MALGLLGRHEEALQIALDKLRGPELTQIAAPDYIFTQSGVLGRHSEAMKELLLFRNRIGDSISSTFWKAWQNLLSNVDLDQEIQKLLDQNPGNGGSEMLQALLLWSQGKHQETIGWLDKIGWDWHHLRAMNLLMLGDFAAAADNLTLEKENLESRHGKHPYLANADDFPPALRLVTCFRKTGEDEAAEKLLREVNQFANSRTVDGYSPSLGYEICIYHLLNGRKKQALEEMEKRIYLTDENFVPLGQFRSFSSPMFEDLHHDSDFREMVAEYERRRSASAESISAMIKAAGY